LLKEFTGEEKQREHGRAQHAASGRQMPLQDTDRHHRRRADVACLIIPDS
jgi:hypothetical protein